MSSKFFDGNFWQAKAEFSNRWGDRIVFTSVGSDGSFKVPECRVESTLARLEAGESPDQVIQSFPVAGA